MANSLTALNPENLRRMIQDFLNNKLVARGFSRTEFRAELKDGDVIDWPYIDDVRVQDYTPGTDLTIDNLNATADKMNINQSKAVTFPVDPTEKAQARDKAFPAKMAKQAAFQLANNIDQAILDVGTSNAYSTVTGGSLTTSNFFSKITDAMASLERTNGADGEMFGVVDPERRALLSQVFVNSGFDEADVSLRNGFLGKAAGFEFFISNNIPVTQTLTVDTQPTAGDTFTIFGVTWTCVADGTAASAGEINIGADLSDFQAIFLTAINGTTPPSANDYIDVSTEDRRILQNAQANAGAWSNDVTTITGYGKVGGTETFTAGTNIFGTESGIMLFGRKGATSLGLQMLPNLYIRPESRQIQDNYITHTLYGTKVFHRDAKRLCKMTYNV